METTGRKNYRTILREELEARCERNPRYSLRSFARDLGVGPARLSDVLNGRYGLSREAALLMGTRLGWSDSESSQFCDLVESEHARARKSRTIAKKRVDAHQQNYSQLTADAFQVVSDWYHYAILELASVVDFQSDPKWIAARLGISEHIVISAIERLKRLELLEVVRGKLRATDAVTASPDGIPSEAIKKFHRQILEKALSAIHLQTVDERDFSSMVLSIDKAQLPRAKKEIKKFRRHFDSLFLKTKKKDEVYCLGIQFFRLSEKTGNSKTLNKGDH